MCTAFVNSNLSSPGSVFKVGEALNKDPGVERLVFAYHDECCAHTKDFRKMQWRSVVSGTMQQKDKGVARMVLDFIMTAQNL